MSGIKVMAYSSNDNRLTALNLETRLKEGVIYPDDNFFNCISTTRTSSRSKRKFVENDGKDGEYWQKRLKNNNAARKSRWKRKSLENYMEKRLAILLEENQNLRLELKNLRDMDITNTQSQGISPQSEEPTQSKHIKSEETVISLEPKNEMCIPLKFRHKNQVHSVFHRD